MEKLKQWPGKLLMMISRVDLPNGSKQMHSSGAAFAFIGLSSPGFCQAAGSFEQGGHSVTGQYMTIMYAVHNA